MYYFASDIHLGAGGPAAARAVEKRFVAWLDEVSRDADAVFILGDLFDFWFEYKRVVPKGFVRVLGKLCELTDRGIRVVFMTGNHDMWVRDYFEAECGVEVYTSPRIMELAGKRVFLAHGDNMKIDHLPVLRFMNAVFRSKTIRFLFSWLVHPDWAMRFGQWWSGKSRKSHLVSEMGDHITDPLIEYAREYAGAERPDYFIFGHMHQPRDYSEGNLRVLCLGEWHSDPVYAVIDSEGNASLKNIDSTMQQYLDLLRKIRKDGIVKSDRTGTGTRSIFGYQMRFDLEAGFPLLTTKKVFLKGVIYELLWFLQGDTNIKYLLDHGVHIWDNDAYRYYNELCVRHGVLPLEREAFLDAVRREEPSSIDGYRPGDLNHVYGYQWRSWPRPDGGCIDQIRQVIDQIKHSPDSRRMLVSAWNVAEVDDMALPPCHVLFQFYVAGGRLSCQLYQRSADTFLGVPFNIASYALLTMMIAQECGLRPGDFVHTLGDAHLYLNHADQVAEQLSRTPRPLPTLRLNPAVRSVFDFRYEDFTLENYDPWPAIKAPMSF